MVSTLALTGGVQANPMAEITVRVRYKPLVSAGAAVFQYFASPLPRSAYIFGETAAAAAPAAAGLGLSGVEQLLAQQHEYCEESLLEGAAPLPAAMVGAMLPPAPGDVSLATAAAATGGRGSAKGVKACTVRIAAALDPFAPELKALGGALSWQAPVGTGLLHVAILTAVFHPWTFFPGLSLWLAVHTTYAIKPGRWTLLGADKSAQSGSCDVGTAPPGSKLLGSVAATMLGPDAPFEAFDGSVGGKSGQGGVTSASRALGVSPSVDTYEGCVQTVYWVQSLLRHAVWVFEGLHDLVTWRDMAKSNAFMVGCFVAAWVMLFVKLKWILLCCSFVALRHPFVAKPATPPYRLGVVSDA